MAKILVLNINTNAIETFFLNEGDPMPYNIGGTLRVREFRGTSRSPTLWTNTGTMEAWNTTRRLYGSGIPVGAAFKRPWEGGHTEQSQHYAGVSFDVGQASRGWNNTQRANLRRIAINSGVWRFVEPVSLTPTWVHFDRRQLPSACSAGYPVLRVGSRSTYVLVLQDGLNTLGFRTGGLTGTFGPLTNEAVLGFQRSRGLVADGVVGCRTWRTLQGAVVGKGRTSTTID